MTTLSDTTRDAEDVQFAIWAKMTPEQRFARAAQMSQLLLEASRAELDRLYPDISETERLILYVKAQYSDDLSEKVARHLKTHRPQR